MYEALENGAAKFGDAVGKVDSETYPLRGDGISRRYLSPVVLMGFGKGVLMLTRAWGTLDSNVQSVVAIGVGPAAFIFSYTFVRDIKARVLLSRRQKALRTFDPQ